MGDPAAPVHSLKWLLLLQRVGTCAFLVGFFGIFGGYGLGFFHSALGASIATAGYALLGLDLLFAVIVVRLLKCPRCGRRFFTVSGFLGLIAKINITSYGCPHCGLARNSHHEDTETERR